MVLPRNDAIYMVPRPLQKLGGDSPIMPTSGKIPYTCNHLIID